MKGTNFFFILFPVGLFTPIHFMMAATSEKSKKDSGSKYAKDHPGLMMILRNDPDVDTVDVNGRTPLIKAIVSNKSNIALRLVCQLTDINPSLFLILFNYFIAELYISEAYRILLSGPNLVTFKNIPNYCLDENFL